MSAVVIAPGLQASIQAAPRRGVRGLGIPASGPADAVAMAFANRLVGNQPETPALEITLGGLSLRFEVDAAIGLSGATGKVAVDGDPAPPDATIRIRKGQVITFDTPREGARCYLAVCGGFGAAEAFGSSSTYMPGGFGGSFGRRLQVGDRLSFSPSPTSLPHVETPPELRRRFSDVTVLRVTGSAEFEALTPGGRDAIFEARFGVSRQIDRMGIRLDGHLPDLRPGCGVMQSGAVFPGIIQCPEGGAPIILGPDAQTTGGYPRLLSVIAADLPLLGQLRPGDGVHLFYRSADEAHEDDLRLFRILRTWVDLRP